MITNNQIRFVKSLQQKKYRNENRLFLVEGVKLYKELKESDFEIESVYGSREMSREFPEIEMVGNKDLERMSGLKTAPPILAVVHQRSWPKMTFDGLTVVLDDINDPGNFGTIIRSADWFGVKRVICSPKTVEVYNSKGIQASMGSVFNMAVYVEELLPIIDQFKANDIPVYGTSLEGEHISKMPKVENAVLIIGSESHGMSQEIEASVDNSFKIPGFGKAESLNAAIACSVILAHLKI